MTWTFHPIHQLIKWWQLPRSCVENGLKDSKLIGKDSVVIDEWSVLAREWRLVVEIEHSCHL